MHRIQMFRSLPYDMNALFFSLNVYKVKNLKLITDWSV